MKINVALTIALTLTTVQLGTVAFAGPPKKSPAVPAKIQCAVETGDTVDVKAATAAKKFADYKGNRYFFCCSDCPKEFKANPAKYAKNAHIKTPAPVKTGTKG